MERRITSWHSPNLGMEMPVVAYGHAGYPLLMFPTAAADFLEYERFYLVDSIKYHIESGRLRAYSINSVNRYSLMNEQAPPRVKADLLSRYDRYITDEVLPLIRRDVSRNLTLALAVPASRAARRKSASSRCCSALQLEAVPEGNPATSSTLSQIHSTGT